MTKLNVSIDLDSLSPNFEFSQIEDDEKFFLDIGYGARKAGDYNNLSFGYTIEENGNLVTDVVRPDSNVTYLRSDQEFIDFNKLEYTPSLDGVDEIINYDINAWCEESGKRYEGTYSFQLIIPSITDPYPDGPDATPESVGKTDLIQ